MNSRLYIFLILLAFTGVLHAQKIIKGRVLDADSSTAMPFVFVINKSNGNGTASDNEGHFSLATSDADTLICSYVGYAKSVVPVKKLYTLLNGEVCIFMTSMPVNLNAVTVTAFKIKPYEREYMKDIIDKSRIRAISGFNSPFTAAYMQFSKEGKQVRKLARIFEELMIEEQVQQKLSPEILRRLTGDSNIDYPYFRRYCFNLTNDYIINHDGFDLYTKVMDCYRRYKAEGH